MLIKRFMLSFLAFLVLPVIYATSYDINVNGVPYFSNQTFPIVGCENCSVTNITGDDWICSHDSLPIFLNGTNSSFINVSLSVPSNVSNGSYQRILYYYFDNSSYDYFDVFNINVTNGYAEPPLVDYDVEVDNGLFIFYLQKEDNLPFNTTRNVLLNSNMNGTASVDISYDSWLNGLDNITLSNGNFSLLIDIFVPENVNNGTFDKNVKFNPPSNVIFNYPSLTFRFVIIEKSLWELYLETPEKTKFQLWLDNYTGNLYHYRNVTQFVNNTEFVRVVEVTGDTWDKILDQINTSKTISVQNEMIDELNEYKKRYDDINETRLREEARKGMIKLSAVILFSFIIIGGASVLLIIRNSKALGGDVL